MTLLQFLRPASKNEMFKLCINGVPTSDLKKKDDIGTPDELDRYEVKNFYSLVVIDQPMISYTVVNCEEIRYD